MDHPFEGIPTIPPRKNTTHMAAFCNGCRYRVTASPDMTVAQVRRTGSSQAVLTSTALSWVRSGSAGTFCVGLGSSVQRRPRAVLLP